MVCVTRLIITLNIAHPAPSVTVSDIDIVIVTVTDSSPLSVIQYHWHCSVTQLGRLHSINFKIVQYNYAEPFFVTADHLAKS